MIPTDPLWWCWEAELPDSLCDSIIEEALLEEPEEGVAGGRIRKTLRDSTVRWLNYNWLTNMVSGYGHMANSVAWNFKLEKCELIQFTEYGLDQKYDFHTDTEKCADGMRKLSVVIQLSDTEDYEGGDFEFKNITQETESVPELRKRGTVLVFPSWHQHRVTPVTRGTRYTLVTWLNGPALV